MSEQPERVIDLSVEVPGTPEQVWSAIATGPGISSWFIPHEVAEHEGGKVVMDFRRRRGPVERVPRRVLPAAAAVRGGVRKGRRRGVAEVSSEPVRLHFWLRVQGFRREGAQVARVRCRHLGCNGGPSRLQAADMTRSCCGF